MKIGILTHHYVKNFGAYMQVFALLNTIKELYPNAEVDIVNYVVKKHRIVNMVHFFGFKPSRGDTLVSLLKKIKQFYYHLYYEKKLPLSKRVKCAEDINKLNYDLIVIGSDEVWNFNDIAYDALKFGVGIECKKITYSASAGGSSIKDDIPVEIKQSMNKFANIAVRDDNTAEIVKYIVGKDVLKTLDPVFLYEYDLKCREKIKKIITKEKYILIYDCKLDKEQSKSIKEFAKNNNYKIFGAGEYRNWYDSYITASVSPFEWAYLFKNAIGIITGTFHGVSFSVKYNKKFVAYLTEENRIKKVSSLLNDFSLKSQIVKKEDKLKLLEILNNEINYEMVNRIIDEKVLLSKKYLEEEIIKN